MGNTYWSATAEVSQVPTAPTDEALDKLRSPMSGFLASYAARTRTLRLEWSFSLLSTTVREAAKDAEWSVRKGLEYAGVQGRITSVQVREHVEGDMELVRMQLMSVMEVAALLGVPAEQVSARVRPVAWIEEEPVFLGEAVHRVLLSSPRK